MTREEITKQFCAFLGQEESIKLKELLVANQKYELASYVREHQRAQEIDIIIKDINESLSTEKLKSDFILYIALLPKNSYDGFKDTLSDFLESEKPE